MKITKQSLPTFMMCLLAFVVFEVAFLYFEVFREAYAYILFPIALICLISIWYFKKPSWQMLRLIRAKKYAEAIKFSEGTSIDQIKSNSEKMAIKINIMAAHFFMNQTDKAREILLSIDKDGNVPKEIEETVKDWKHKLLT